MQVVNSKRQIANLILELRKKYFSIGFVPTMGALHKGHVSLISEALRENDVVFVSIFVNPTQFNNKEDLKSYPRTFDKDVELIKTVSKSKIFIYAPTVEDMYPKNIISTSFDFDGLENEMEGAFRKGHFDGVGTIVKRLLKLLNLIRPTLEKKIFSNYKLLKN